MPIPSAQKVHVITFVSSHFSYMVGCQGYPRCRASAFFPKFVIEASVDESLCGNCQPGDVHKVKFKFKRGSVPPMMPLE